jgi:hypothetical protein
MNPGGRGIFTASARDTAPEITNNRTCLAQKPYSAWYEKMICMIYLDRDGAHFAVRQLLYGGNVELRRRWPRLPTTFAYKLYPNRSQIAAELGRIAYLPTFPENLHVVAG